MVKKRVVQAVASASHSRGNPERARRIEAAYAEAIGKAGEDGLSLSTDAHEVKSRMAAARASVLAAEAENQEG